MLMIFSKGSLLRVKGFVPIGLEEILRRLKAADDDEIPGIAGFMGRCLTLDPAERPDAQELLKDPWLAGV
jgi:serine/threonine-protein kinase SRPK3